MAFRLRRSQSSAPVSASNRLRGWFMGRLYRLRGEWVSEEDRLVVAPAASLRPPAEWNPLIRMKSRMNGAPDWWISGFD